MLAVIGFWQGYQSLLNKSIGRRIYTAVGVVLIAVSIFVTTLVALSVNNVRFDIIPLLSFAR